MFISRMFIMPSFKKSLIVEQFLGNYLKWRCFPRVLLAQWIERPPSVREVFFFLPRSWHVDQFTFHSMTNLSNCHSCSFVQFLVLFVQLSCLDNFVRDPSQGHGQYEANRGTCLRPLFFTFVVVFLLKRESKTLLDAKEGKLTTEIASIIIFFWLRLFIFDWTQTKKVRN